VSGSLFGILIMDRDPTTWFDLYVGLLRWTQEAGAIAAVGLFLWLLIEWLRKFVGNLVGPAPGQVSMEKLELLPLIILNAFAGLGIVAALTGVVLRVVAAFDPAELGRLNYVGLWTGFYGGAVCIIIVLVPFVRELLQMSTRRIYALAKLSFQEAVRRRIIWVFLAFFLIFLFPQRWFTVVKPEHEIRDTVTVVYYAMTPLLLVTAGLLAATAIPADIRNQTIHTIITKPVVRFEILVGRFLGYATLLTLILFGMCAVSLSLILVSRISPEAAEESFKAREVVYGQLAFGLENGSLEFDGPKGDFQGDSVGREWEYRRHIAGGTRTPQRGVYLFPNLPSDLGNRSDRISTPCEFSFDIFRTTKGEENRGVDCTFTFVTWQFNPDEKKKYRDELTARRPFGNAQPIANKGLDDPANTDWKVLDELAGKYGIYEFKSKTISDYQTFAIEVPQALFRKALEGTPPTVARFGQATTKPRLMVIVKCESRTQFVGMARYDLYFLAGDYGFVQNYFKGALGLWFRLMLVLGVAIACSTYLSGVIGFLATMFLFMTGVAQSFILELAQGRAVGGGPGEALTRLVTGQNLVNELEASAAVNLAKGFDAGFRVALNVFLNVVPDVNNYEFSTYVAVGFNVPLLEVLGNGLSLLGYLFPWAILAYYLMRSREIAA
jgi:ABC-type transport system involved in multi-copper enzyme maturation permease subunit